MAVVYRQNRSRTPLQVGLALLPANLIMGAFSLGISAKLVMRFGIKRPLATGLLLAAAGLALFARAPVGGHFAVDVLPSMILLGFGAGTAFNPILPAAMGDVEPGDPGLASGIVNTSFMMGGALGLAVLASVAASRTSHLIASGHSRIGALDAGCHTAFLVGAAESVDQGVTSGPGAAWSARTNRGQRVTCAHGRRPRHRTAGGRAGTDRTGARRARARGAPGGF